MVNDSQGRRRRDEEKEDEENEEFRRKYLSLEGEHKKIKKIASSMVDMMRKVDGVDGGAH